MRAKGILVLGTSLFCVSCGGPSDEECEAANALRNDILADYQADIDDGVLAPSLYPCALPDDQRDRLSQERRDLYESKCAELDVSPVRDCELAEAKKLSPIPDGPSDEAQE